MLVLVPVLVKKLRPGAGTVNGIINVCRIKGTGISLRDKGDRAGILMQGPVHVMRRGGGKRRKRPGRRQQETGDWRERAALRRNKVSYI